MLNSLDTASLALEGRSLNELKLAAKQDPNQSIHVVAKQFEAMLTNLMTKSMRGSTGGDSLFENNETRMYTELLDQQFAQKMSAGKGLGIADMLVSQMLRNQASAQTNPLNENASNAGLPIEKQGAMSASAYCLPGAATTPLTLSPKTNDATLFQLRPNTTSPLAPTAPTPNTAPRATPLSPKEFISQFRPYVESAARELGVAAKGVMAHIALESGWGKHEIKNADGSPSYNVLGIKANAQWQGKVTEVSTTEYVNGVAQRRVEKFRAYDSYAQAFQDYAGLLKNAPRYQAVLNSGAAQNFAQGLQKAGYATDPQYAAKLTRIAQGGLLRTMV